jgi:hypothetical protein
MSDSNAITLQLGSDEHVELLIALEAADAAPPGVFIIQSTSAKVRKQSAMRLAKALGRQLTPVGLDGLKSAVPGEAEKMLGTLFETALARNWVLFFDEADALFGNKPVRDEDLSTMVRELLLNAQDCVIVGALKTKSAGRFWKDFMQVLLKE